MGFFSSVHAGIAQHRGPNGTHWTHRRVQGHIKDICFAWVATLPQKFHTAKLWLWWMQQHWLCKTQRFLGGGWGPGEEEIDSGTEEMCLWRRVQPNQRRILISPQQQWQPRPLVLHVNHWTFASQPTQKLSLPLSQARKTPSQNHQKAVLKLWQPAKLSSPPQKCPHLWMKFLRSTQSCLSIFL